MNQTKKKTPLHSALILTRARLTFKDLLVRVSICLCIIFKMYMYNTDYLILLKLKQNKRTDKHNFKKRFKYETV